MRHLASAMLAGYMALFLPARALAWEKGVFGGNVGRLQSGGAHGLVADWMTKNDDRNLKALGSRLQWHRGWRNFVEYSTRREVAQYQALIEQVVEAAAQDHEALEDVIRMQTPA